HDREVAQRIGPEVDPDHGGHPAKVERKEENQHRALPEDGDGQSQQRTHPGDIVDGASSIDGGGDPRQHTEDEGEGHGERRQLQGHRQALEDEANHRLAGAPGRAPVPLRGGRGPCAYCTYPGWSSPKKRLSCSTICGLTTASAPIICSTTVPGIRRSIRKMSTVRPSNVKAME